MKTNIIYNKSCISMPEVDDNSIDTICTSPPYWGLRDYGKEANQIWGGLLECEHQWGNSLVIKERGSIIGPTAQVRNQQNPNIAKTHSIRGQFCSLCHAWRGQLGLEPTLEMYIDHLLLITAECRRVLKPTGVMWWVHGDCYFTGKGSCNNPGGGNKSWQSWNDKKAIYPRGRGAPNRMSKEIPAKCLALQNYRLILRLIDEQGWILRNDVKWYKPNGMPSSVKDRLTNKYEPVFMLVKNKKYWFDLDAIREPHREVKKEHTEIIGVRSIEEEMAQYDRKGIRVPGQSSQGIHRKRHSGYYGANGEYLVNPKGKNPGDVWSIPTQPYPEAHFATFPEKLILKPILSSCPEGGIVLDPFAGSGTTLAMAKRYNRQYIGYEVSKSYIPLIRKRLAKEDTLFNSGKISQI